jgi:hypothetical protein
MSDDASTVRLTLQGHHPVPDDWITWTCAARYPRDRLCTAATQMCERGGQDTGQRLDGLPHAAGLVESTSV